MIFPVWQQVRAKWFCSECTCTAAAAIWIHFLHKEKCTLSNSNKKLIQPPNLHHKTKKKVASVCSVKLPCTGQLCQLNEHQGHRRRPENNWCLVTTSKHNGAISRDVSDSCISPDGWSDIKPCSDTVHQPTHSKDRCQSVDLCTNAFSPAVHFSLSPAPLGICHIWFH